MGLLHYAKINLVDQSGGLECVIATLVTQARGGHATEFVMQENKKPGFCLLVAGAKVKEETRHFSGQWGHSVFIPNVKELWSLDSKPGRLAGRNGRGCTKLSSRLQI
jgi:hypothetical protein